MMEDKCTNCKGTGRQVFHGSFESAMGTCNFCRGTAKREDQLRCLENITKNENVGTTQGET